jgi:SPX domain protein involved in polyphosphate accumulation
LRARVTEFAKLDPYCARCDGDGYVVRSVYYDTDDFNFYFDKIDGHKVRKKLRVRAYDLPDPVGDAFIEIKRKFGNLTLKERLCLPMLRVDDALNGKDPSNVLSEPSFRNRRILGKIRYLMHIKGLRPVVLVTYDREAFLGRNDTSQRVTFDRNIRSLPEPGLEQIFSEDELRRFESRYFVLELKFNQRMPRWMARLIRDYDLVARPYSKYCRGLDAWQTVPIGDSG